MMAFVAMAAALVMTSCDKEDNGTPDNGNGTGGNGDTPASYTLTVQPNNAEWGTVTGSGTYAEGTSVNIEATPATGYYFIKWSDGEAANPRKVTVNSNMTLYALFSSDPNDPNPLNPGDNPNPGPGPQPVPDGWVDLGLPSGLLWATCNLGATAPEDFGDYYAWGETQTKNHYGWSTYLYCNWDGVDDEEGTYQTMTKYNTSSVNGNIDNLTILQAMDDAATAVLGNGARTPTKEEWEELINNTTVETFYVNNVKGRKFTAANGNSIFLPAASHWSYGEFNAQDEGQYWSSSLCTTYPYRAWAFEFMWDANNVNHLNRCYGFSVRAVRAPQK